MTFSSRLRYVNAEEAGFIRSGKPPRFTYLGLRGKSLTSQSDLHRIQALVIPPAWSQVWICKDSRGHLQATGVDARGRKQYLYHPKWRELQEASKFERCLLFAKQLPRIRRRVAAHLQLPGLPQEKVLATIVRLLDTTLIRVGNEEYSKQNNSFGLTTLLDKHAKTDSKQVKLKFRGKSGVEHEFSISEPRLVKNIKHCQDLPGQQLFQYRDDTGKVRDVKSTDVNRYLQEITKEDITAKDFRTWAAGRLIVKSLVKFGKPTSEIDAERKISAAIKEVAHQLGNTIAVCRKSYVHPKLLEAYRNFSGRSAFGSHITSGEKCRSGLSLAEQGVIDLLRKKAKAS